MRIEQLTFTRFWAALAIVIYHFGRETAINNEYTLHLFSNVGVSYFFILSGFVMLIAYNNTERFNLKQYFINRFARIYPLYILALLLIIFLKLVFSHDIGLREVTYSIFAVQAWTNEYVLSLNGPGWSISVEIFFYLLFPFFLLKVYRIQSIKRNLFYILLFWTLSQIVFHIFILNNSHTSNWFNFFYYSPIMHINEFLMGNLAGLIFLKYKNEYVKTIFFRNNSILIIVCLLVLLIFLKYPLVNYHNGFLALIYVPLILFYRLMMDFFIKY